jgi:DNA-binding IclR family transcriptional regulator
MARPAPAVDRTVALMTFLADRPQESFGLTELSRRLEISKATIHSMVATLTDAGWLSRDAHKRYRLGPGLVNIAKSATNSQQLALDVAADHMRRLGGEYAARCIACAAMGDELVILAAQGPSSALGVAADVGHRVSFAAPLGAVFLAWSDPELIESWVADAGIVEDAGAAERFRESLRTIRRRGFALTRQLVRRELLNEVLAELSRSMPRRTARQITSTLLRELEQEEAQWIVTEIDPQEIYDASYLTAPVFDARGRIVLSLGLIFGVDVQLSGAQLTERGERLVEATQAVTEAIRGVNPVPGASQRAASDRAAPGA